jgi:hypothetical protein
MRRTFHQETQVTHNMLITRHIQEFADQVNLITGWTLIPSVTDKGILFDCDAGSIFYPWRILDEMDAEAVGAAINAAVIESQPGM